MTNASPIAFKKNTGKYKVVIIGDAAVGKTSIIHRFTADKFDENQNTTIGIDFLSKTMYLEDSVIRFQLWDTAGMERFRSLIPSYIRDSCAAIVTYDITDRLSFNNIDKWINDIYEEKGNDVIIMLCGNKIDLNKQRQITKTEAESKAKKYKTLYKEVSAKTGENVKEMFAIVGSKLCERDIHYIDQDINLDMDSMTTEEPGWCGCALL
eukprot:489346_1